jgi:hypothetical protein
LKLDSNGTTVGLSLIVIVASSFLQRFLTEDSSGATAGHGVSVIAIHPFMKRYSSSFEQRKPSPFGLYTSPFSGDEIGQGLASSACQPLPSLSPVSGS